jgi:hypothetical protein
MRRISAALASDFPSAFADLVQDRQRARATRGQLQHIERQAFGLLGRAASLRLRGALLERRQMTTRLARPEARDVKLTAARAGAGRCRRRTDVDAAVRLTEEHVLGTYRADTSP